MEAHNSYKYPLIRFVGFSDAWERRKLGDIGETYTGLSGKTKEDFGHGNAKFVTYMNVFSNSIADSTMTEAVEIDKKQNEVKYGDVFFTTSSETPDEVGMSCVWLENSENTYLNSFCFGYRPSVEISPYYIAYMLRSENVRKNIVFLAQGISRYNISKNKMMEISVPLPMLDEQQKIGEYFRNLDNLITLHQRKCEKLKRIKKSMLRKMFPQNGSLYPEVRIGGFTDAWEQRKLGEVLSQLKDGTHGTHQNSDDGVYLLSAKNIKNGQIVIDEETDRKISIEEYETIHSNFRLKEDDVLLTIVGSIGETAILKNPDIATFQRSVAFLRPNEDTISIFLKTEIDTDIFQKELADRKSQSAQPGVYLGELEKIPFYITNIQEQQKIGLFFSHLDSLITLHQRKCEKLLNIKQSLLSDMFV